MSRNPRRAEPLPPATSLCNALRRLDELAPDVPLVAFGQTPLWDEPMKAVVGAAATRPMMVGIHDLDFFSRLRAPLPGDPWQIVPRNDADLRDPWIAAGELSALFGAEVCPTRQALIDAGLRIDMLLPEGDDASDKDLARLTEAWGWKGIVQNALEPTVICDLPLRDVAPFLIKLVRWAFNQSARLLGHSEHQRAARALGREITAHIRQLAGDHPEAPLSDLFTQLLERIYRLLLGELPPNVSIRNTGTLLRFNRTTAARPRFRLLGHFLDPRTDLKACDAYDQAVADSPVAKLRELGPGALPFDLYVPHRGRGTLHVAPQQIRIDLPNPVAIPLARPVRKVTELAGVLEDELGPYIALTGKALVLIPMLAGEFVVVLNETGSAYIPRTRQILTTMRSEGIPLRLHPLLRMRLRTWDAFAACDLALRLPEHLAQALSHRDVTAAEFGRHWKGAVQEQRSLLKRLGAIARPADLTPYLPHEEHEQWFRKLDRAVKANAALLDIQRRLDSLRHQTLDTRSREDDVQSEIKTLEGQRGELNRTRIRPLKQKLKAPRACLCSTERKRIENAHKDAAKQGRALLLAIEAKQAERRKLRARRTQLNNQIRKLERGAKATAARRTRNAVITDAEKARVRIARNAILAVEGLTHTNFRPAAWWMPAVDPSGEWFRKIRQTARFRLESLVEEPA